MASTGLDVFDKSVVKSLGWVDEVANQLGTPERHLAYSALRASLQTLRDRLTPEQAAMVAAELPLVLRGTFYEGYKPGSVPKKWNDSAEFSGAVRQQLDGGSSASVSQQLGENFDDQVRKVLGVVSGKLAPGVSEKVAQALPDSLREIWPAAA